MKKIILLLCIFLLGAQISFAKDYTLNFNGSKFHLLYSVKSKDFNGYLNEYYKKGETYNIWSELVAVHHFPNAYSPIDRIKDFKDYLGSMHVPSSLTFDDKKNTAIIDFIVITEHKVPTVLEFNIFKYEKSKNCGSIAVQYAKRYSATTALQIEEIKKEFEQNRKKLIKKVERFKAPELVSEDIDLCISAADVTEKKEQKTETENKIAEETKLPESTTESVVEENENISENQIDEPVNEKEEKIADENSEDAPQVISAAEEEKAEEVNKPEEENEVKVSENPEPIIKKAPVPASKNEANIKEVNYQIINDKEDLIANKRTKKDLKNEVKQKKLNDKNKKKQEKIQAKQNKKQAKEDAKNLKKAEKMAKIPYKVSNNNSDLIAKPRTKKELKANNKRLKKEAAEKRKANNKNQLDTL